MDTKLLISKIALDKDYKKLGKIIRIELLPGKTIKKDIPYAMILFSKPFKKDIVVPIEAEKLIKYDSQYAWFNITKKAFEEEVKRIAQNKELREKYLGVLPQLKMSNRTMYSNVDYTGLIKTPKERRR